MLRLLHTADWHLGRRFPSFPEEAQKKLSRARMDVIATNREVRLIAVHVERGAMDAPDAYPCVTGFARRKRHREVVLSCLRSARPRIEDHVRRERIREVIPVNDMHPCW